MSVERWREGAEFNYAILTTVGHLVAAKAGFTEVRRIGREPEAAGETARR
jgi:hypothetical protein